MKIAQRQEIVIFFLIIILSLCVGYNVLYKYSQRKITSIKSQIEEEGKKNGTLETIEVLNKKLLAYQQLSLDTTEITQLLDIVSRLADSAGITIEGFDPQLPRVRKQYTEIYLKMPFRCNYHRLGKFLSLIESNRKFIQVRELTMSKPNSSDSDEIDVNLQLSGIYFGE